MQSYRFDADEKMLRIASEKKNRRQSRIAADPIASPIRSWFGGCYCCCCCCCCSCSFLHMHRRKMECFTVSPGMMYKVQIESWLSLFHLWLVCVCIYFLTASTEYLVNHLFFFGITTLQCAIYVAIFGSHSFELLNLNRIRMMVHKKGVKWIFLANGYDFTFDQFFFGSFHFLSYHSIFCCDFLCLDAFFSAT